MTKVYLSTCRDEKNDFMEAMTVKRGVFANEAARAKQGGHFCSLCFQTAIRNSFLASASSTRDWRPAVQVASPQYRRKKNIWFESKTEIVQMYRAEPNVEEQSTRKRFYSSSGCLASRMRLARPTRARGRQSYMAVMDKIGGWHEEGGRIEGYERHEGSQIGGRLAGCIWIFSKNTDMQ